MSRNLFPLAIVLGFVGLAFFLASNPKKSSTTDKRTPPMLEQGLEMEDVLNSAEATPAPNAAIRRTTKEIPATTNTGYSAQANDGILISVIDSTTNEALPQAELFVLDSRKVDMDRWRQQISSGTDLERAFRYAGETYLTDSQGQVRIPKPAGVLTLAGSTDTHFHFDFNIDWSDNTYTLGLKPVELLEVRVVDESGSPVEGAPVAIRQNDGANSQDLGSFRTNSNGIASLKIFGKLKDVMSKDTSHVALQILSPSPIETPVDFNNLPQEPLVLIMPEVGEVTVLLHNDVGKPLLSYFLVQLLILNPEDSASTPLLVQQWDFFSNQLLHGTVTGISTFPFVTLNQQLRIRVSSPMGESTATYDGAGPEAPNQKVTITITPGTEFPVLVGRVLLAQGEVGKNISMDARVNKLPDSGHPVWSGRVHTDTEGRFLTVLDRQLSAQSPHTFTLTLRATDHEPMQIVRVNLEEDLTHGKHDLGNLLLQEAPLVAHGTVVDQQGNLVAKASVRLETALLVQAGKNDFVWDSMSTTPTSTDENGRFEIRGFFPEGRYRVVASHHEYRAGSKEFSLGATDIEIQLLSSANRMGRVLLDPEINPADLQITVHYPSPRGGGNTTTFLSLNADGRFRLTGLPASKGTIRIRSAFLGEDLVVFEDLMLQSLETAILLEAIDLRGQLTFFSLTVVDENGEQIEDVRTLLDKASTMSWSAQQPLPIITRQTSLDLQITADGYRSVSLHAVNSDQEVILPAGIPVSIILDNAHLLPEDWEVQAQLVYFLPDTDDESLSNRKTANSYVPLDGTEIRVMKAQRYKVYFHLRCTKRNLKHGNKTWGLPGESPYIVVEDSDYSQIFHISLDAQALDFAQKRSAAGQ